MFPSNACRISLAFSGLGEKSGAPCVYILFFSLSEDMLDFIMAKNVCAADRVESPASTNVGILVSLLLLHRKRDTYLKTVASGEGHRVTRRKPSNSLHI